MSSVERVGRQNAIDLPPQFILAVDWHQQADMFRLRFEQTGDPDYLQMVADAEEWAAQRQRLLYEIHPPV